MITDSVLRAAHTSRRVVQTPRAFSNWAEVLSDMARERVGHGPETLSFAARSGLRIDCPNVPGARVPIYEIFAEDTYRLNWFLGPLMQRPIQVLDIGGHIGTFACQLAQVHPGATIQCFEPSPTTAGFLRRNVAQNGLGDRISVSERALAAETGFAVFDDNGGGSGTNGLVGAGRSVASGTATKVETVAFDEAVASTPAPIDFVKMDCEGGEYDLTYGSSRDSWASVQRLVLEYHEVEGQSWAQLRDWFGSVGLHVVRQKPVNDALGTAWLSRGAVAG
ncbi:MAG TPA: FkbM family methyltransferase [Acidimicrobiales bacterium]|nr:FkbM family methyltransferase [Acidimicrobiales bacterium]